MVVLTSEIARETWWRLFGKAIDIVLTSAELDNSDMMSLSWSIVTIIIWFGLLWRQLRRVFWRHLFSFPHIVGMITVTSPRSKVGFAGNSTGRKNHDDITFTINRRYRYMLTIPLTFMSSYAFIQPLTKAWRIYRQTWTPLIWEWMAESKEDKILRWRVS